MRIVQEKTVASCQIDLTTSQGRRIWEQVFDDLQNCKTEHGFRNPIIELSDWSYIISNKVMTNNSMHCIVVSNYMMCLNRKNYNHPVYVCVCVWLIYVLSVHSCAEIIGNITKMKPINANEKILIQGVCVKYTLISHSKAKSFMEIDWVFIFPVRRKSINHKFFLLNLKQS